MESTSDGGAAALRRSVGRSGVREAFDAVWAAAPGKQTVGTVSFAVAALASAVMILRTVIYVVRRRQGLAGPANARRLAKFWALFGAVQFLSINLRAYLDPFGLTWLLYLCRAVVLLAVTSGQQLSRSERLYDDILSPFYDEHAPEIEQQLGRGQEGLRNIDNAARELAKYLLDHVAVGGLSGGVRALAQLAKASDDSSQVRKERPSAHDSADGMSIASAGLARDFHAGEAAARAAAISNCSGIARVVVPGKKTNVRPAYESSRALRAEFRRMHARREMATSEDGSVYSGD